MGVLGLYREIISVQISIMAVHKFVQIENRRARNIFFFYLNSFGIIGGTGNKSLALRQYFRYNLTNDVQQIRIRITYKIVTDLGHEHREWNRRQGV